MISFFSLKLRQEEWNERLTELPSTETLLANCVISAAFLTYCGPLQAQAMLVHIMHKMSLLNTRNQFLIKLADMSL